MFDSGQKVYKLVEAIAPASLKPLARLKAAEFLFLMGYKIFKRGHVLKAIGVIGRAHAMHLGCGITCCISMVADKIKSLRSKKSLRKASGNSTLRQFSEYDPKEHRNYRIGYATSRKLAWLTARGQHIGRPKFSERLRRTVNSI
jgi:hypothetical protein